MKHVDVREAHRLQQSNGHVYVDVRSIAEFECGHPAGAYNIPLFHLDPASRQMTPNREFLQILQANFPPDANLLVGCQVGGRSAQAAQLLTGAGYQNVANVLGGYRGAWDPTTGRTIHEGWTQAGLPVETESAPGCGYEALRGKLQP